MENWKGEEDCGKYSGKERTSNLNILSHSKNHDIAHYKVKYA